MGLLRWALVGAALCGAGCGEVTLEPFAFEGSVADKPLDLFVVGTGFGEVRGSPLWISHLESGESQFVEVDGNGRILAVFPASYAEGFGPLANFELFVDSNSDGRCTVFDTAFALVAEVQVGDEEAFAEFDFLAEGVLPLRCEAIAGPLEEERFPPGP